MRVDLHTHSLHSDGVRTPEWVVSRAAANGATLLALTDHDTLNGIPAALAAGRAAGLRVLPGVELGTRNGELGELHVLGYFPRISEPDDSAIDTIDTIESVLAGYRDDRLTRAGAIVDRLDELGVPVGWERVERIANGAAVGRPHVARALVEAGHVESVQEAFNQYLHDEGPAYVGRALLDLEHAVQLIHEHDGLAGLAHPTRARDTDAAVKRFAAAGGDSIEVWYRDDDAERVAHSLELARQAGLMPTAGSDWHGLHEREIEPGAVAQPTNGAQAFIEACAANRSGAR